MEENIMNEQEKNVLYMYPDGACVPNPGAGGWAVLLDFNGVRKIMHGSVEDSTNQRMEIYAAIKGFEALKAGHILRVVVTSDSQYLINCMSGEWGIKSNTELFSQLEYFASPHQVTWQWVKGHSGHAQNEIVNTLANQEAARLHRQVSRKL
jgi:ribonuclease HI